MIPPANGGADAARTSYATADAPAAPFGHHRSANLNFVPRPQREVPPPLEGNDLIITASCTAAWAVALIVVVVLRHHLPAGHNWWIWVCVTGLGLGVFGLIYVPYLKRSRAKAAQRRAQAAQARQSSS